MGNQPLVLVPGPFSRPHLFLCCSMCLGTPGSCLLVLILPTVQGRADTTSWELPGSRPAPRHPWALCTRSAPPLLCLPLRHRALSWSLPVDSVQPLPGEGELALLPSAALHLSAPSSPAYLVSQEYPGGGCASTQRVAVPTGRDRAGAATEDGDVGRGFGVSGRPVACGFSQLLEAGRGF